MKKMVMLLALVMMLGTGLAEAAPINAAYGASVTLNGQFFNGGWSGGDVPSNQQDRANTLVDGVFLNQNHQWNKGTVWWDARYKASWNNSITIDLGDSFAISSFTAQLDDNDGYILDYWDGDSWELAWDIPNYNYYNGRNLWGMQTRPNPYDDSAQFMLPSIIVTDALRLRGDNFDGDRFFAASEIQAYGERVNAPVPEPGTIILLGSGLAGLFLYRRKQVTK